MAAKLPEPAVYRCNPLNLQRCSVIVEGTATSIMIKGDATLVKRVASISSTDVDTSQKAYEDWALTYEKDLLDNGYAAPRISCRYVCDTIPKEKRAKVQVLDVGAGTGLVAKGLREEGFKNIDALEPNEAMLSLARQHNLYDNYFVEYITGEPSTLQAGTYDVLIGSGIFAQGGHVPSEAVQEMIRLVKPGGFIVIVTRVTLLTDTDVYRDLEPLMERLEAEGKWKKIHRDVKEKFYMDYDAITWQYQKL